MYLACSEAPPPPSYALQLVPDGPLSASSPGQVFSQGLLWSVEVRPEGGGDPLLLRLTLRCAYPPSGEGPVPAAGALALLPGPTISVSGQLHCDRPQHGCGAVLFSSQAPSGRLPCLMAYSWQSGQVEAEHSMLLDLSAARDLAGWPLAWASLFGPTSPFTDEDGTLHVAVGVEVQEQL